MQIMRSLSRSLQPTLKKKGACGPQAPDPTPSNWCRWQQAGQGPRDSTARPATLQVPDKNPESPEIRRHWSVKQCMQRGLAKSSDLGPGFARRTVKCLHLQKAFEGVGFSLHKLCVSNFLFHGT